MVLRFSLVGCLWKQMIIIFRFLFGILTFGLSTIYALGDSFGIILNNPFLNYAWVQR
jgi:hypothetical protein